MKLAKISSERLRDTFREWDVDEEWTDVTVKYLLYGFHPGSFFTSLYANDAWGAIMHSHPSNRITNLKNLIGWIVNINLEEAFGSYEKVGQWTKMSAEKRRDILEKRGLIFSEKDETFYTLQAQ